VYSRRHSSVIYLRCAYIVSKSVSAVLASFPYNHSISSIPVQSKQALSHKQARGRKHLESRSVSNQNKRKQNAKAKLNMQSKQSALPSPSFPLRTNKCDTERRPKAEDHHARRSVEGARPQSGKQRVGFPKASNGVTAAIRDLDTILQVAVDVHEPPLVLPLLTVLVVRNLPRLVEG